MTVTTETHDGEAYTTCELTMAEALADGPRLAAREDLHCFKVRGRLVAGQSAARARQGYYSGTNDFVLVEGNHGLPLRAEHDVHLRLETLVEAGAMLTLEGGLFDDGEEVWMEVWGWEPRLAWVTPAGERRVKRNDRAYRRQADAAMAAEEAAVGG